MGEAPNGLDMVARSIQALMRGKRRGGKKTINTLKRSTQEAGQLCKAWHALLVFTTPRGEERKNEKKTEGGGMGEIAAWEFERIASVHAFQNVKKGERGKGGD